MRLDLFIAYDIWKILGGMTIEWLVRDLCEWLMGFPTGWTDLEPLGMRRFLLWQQLHGKF